MRDAYRDDLDRYHAEQMRDPEYAAAYAAALARDGGGVDVQSGECMVSVVTQIAGAPGRNGSAESRRRREEEDERVPQWWDADGWYAYRERHGLPHPETYDD